jgi:hypothetical protein
MGYRDYHAQNHNAYDAPALVTEYEVQRIHE